MIEKQTGPEQEGFYDILQNGAGDLLISIRARSGEPEHPQIVYDGGKHALLYRQQGFSITLDFIHPDARGPLSKAETVLVVEFEGGELIREYDVPVRFVKKLPLSPENLPSMPQ
ncbi:MAG: hypothetical protein MJ250_01400 [Alphaproteobacteria bacterium]|nr:hypothetical protein [Alphaproteobacteria bacterium]